MPKPYLGGSWAWGFSLIETRPTLAAHIGFIVAKWSLVEVELARIFALILHTDALIGTKIYSMIRSEGARTEVIEAMIKERLTESDLTEYQRLKRRVRRVGSQRDKVAHGMWATSLHRPDCILLIDTRSQALLEASMTALGDRAAESAGHRALFDSHKDSLLEYYEEDFQQLQGLIQELYNDLGRFASPLQERNRLQASPAHPER